MKPDQSRSAEAVELRRQAEAKLEADLKPKPRPINEADLQRLLHELQVHQVELELQNEELRQARDAAENALGMYADLYDFAPMGYMTLDRDGLICAANLTLATLLGLARSRLIGRRFGSFLADDALSDFTGFVDRAFASQTKEACELALRSGEKPQRAVRIEAVVTDSGEECRAAVIDISVRRRLEKTLEGLHTDLLARAAELEAANLDLEAFNYSVSHDLRGPLTVITGYCDVIDELFGSKLDEQCLGFIRTIHKATIRMSQLIDTLLDFSQVKRIELHNEQVDLTKMAEEVILDLKMAEPERRVTSRLDNKVVANGDANLLRVVLDNLIGNAWKYSCEQEETVIEFGETDAGGQRAYYVRDNGPGFSMEHMEKLFIPFQRLPGSEVAGHGIGLATVDRIVRRHGGRVWAESQPGEGAAFYFTLP